MWFPGVVPGVAPRYGSQMWFQVWFPGLVPDVVPDVAPLSWWHTAAAAQAQHTVLIHPSIPAGVNPSTRWLLWELTLLGFSPGRRWWQWGHCRLW